MPVQMFTLFKCATVLPGPSFVYEDLQYLGHLTPWSLRWLPDVTLVTVPHMQRVTARSGRLAT